MEKEMKRKNKKILYFVFCVLLFWLLNGLTLFAGAAVVNSFKGVISALQYGICLMMICKDHKYGLVISLFLQGFNFLSVSRAVIMGHNLAPLPGMINSLFYILTVLILTHYFKVREQEAVSDVLTGLLNRRGLYDLLIDTTENQKEFSVIYVDLGNFKFINDNYGHACGDQLLKTISERMVGVVGKWGTVTRIGGDEFVIVLDGGIDPGKTANEIMRKIREKASVMENGSQVDCYLTCYAGIALYPQDTREYNALIKYSDIAMYQAAKEKSPEPVFFSREMAESISRELEVEKLIKEGLEHSYFYLVYQPQYLIGSKKLRGFESLLRLKTPDGKFVSPGEFIPVAEKSDLILHIDDYVLKRAMNEFKDIVSDKKSDLVISVNVSAKNIGALDFPYKIKSIIDSVGFPAKNLEIEITEYCLVQSMDITIDNIKKLREMGVQVALDDFGTGYTSLNYLAKMPISLLKVDKSLVDDICANDKSRDFVHAVISMGHLMGCEVISEGVEDEAQIAVLRNQECDLVQGYVWGRPMEYSVVMDMLSK